MVLMRLLGAAAVLIFLNAPTWAAPASTPASNEPTAAGLWEQSDDKGNPESWFRIAEKDGVYTGVVVKIVSNRVFFFSGAAARRT